MQIRPHFITRTKSWPLINFLFVFALVTWFVYSCTEPVLPYQNTALSFEERASDLVSRMTLEEKVSQMVHNSPAIERLGIPEYNWWNECLHGVGRAGLATVFPQAIGLAAMWDEDEMFQIASVISDEARAKHHDFIRQNKRGIYQGLTFWTPNINIFRDPRWGRGMETYGEDPYLTGQLAVNFVKGLQGDNPKYFKLIATAKHYMVHSGPEPDRHRFQAIPSQRDLVETYTPHFKKVIQEAGVYSVMCAYKRLFDDPCCGSEYLNHLLRNEWGFEGYMVSDCGAIQDFYKLGDHEVSANVFEASAKAVKAGTDLNCGESYPALVDAVRQGLISEDYIDLSVKRLMVARMKLGMFDPPSMVPFTDIPVTIVHNQEHQLKALDAARKSIVLLKNYHNILPLSKNVKSVAVIGPNAHNADALLGNYNGFSPNLITPFDGIKQKLPGVNVRYAQGSRWAEGFPFMKIIPSDFLFTDIHLKQHGLKAEYFNNASFEGKPSFVGIDTNIDFVWWNQAPKPGINPDEFSVRWSGYLVPRKSGEHYIGGDGFSGFTLYLNDEELVQRESIHRPEMTFKKVSLKAGIPYKITMEYKQNKSTYPMAKLVWDEPCQKLKQEAIELAKKSDVVVLCMGLSPLLEGEEMDVEVPGFKGGDRTEIALPPKQIELIKAIMALKKPTVLVLLNGSALAINWEAENVPAVLEAWYPGQQGGNAIADVLFGDYNPSGRLPVTFYKSVNQLPPFDDYNMDGRTYKYLQQEPLFRFGYGLSYTSFRYSDLTMAETILADEGLDVCVNVTNTGTIDGDEVVQLYITHHSNGNAPIRCLQGFKRIHLKKGETKTVSFRLTPQQFGLYHADYNKVVYSGPVTIYVGGQQPDSELVNNGVVLEKNIYIKGEFVCR